MNWIQAAVIGCGVGLVWGLIRNIVVSYIIAHSQRAQAHAFQWVIDAKYGLVGLVLGAASNFLWNLP